MPRSPTVLTPPPGTLPFVPNTTIESGKANAVWLDLYQDGNTPRPIAYGGTGASNAADALNNLGAVGQSNFLAAYSIGDFYDTVRNISNVDGVWLRRNGALYDSSSYPALAALLPPLPDGVTWTPTTLFSSGLANGLVYGPSGLVLANDDLTDTKIYTSPDASTWSNVSTITGFRARYLVYGGGVYVLGNGASGTVSSSNDAVTWSTPVSVNTHTSISGLAYGAGLFVACGDSGKISTSPDGVTWTTRTSGVSGTFFNVRYVNSLFVATGVATGPSGLVTTSPDGITWTPRTSGVSVTLYDCAFGSGVYALVGGNGTILTTTNFSGFSPRTSGTTQSLNAVTYSSAGFVAVGASGTARISSDAITWTASSTGVSSTLSVVIFNPTMPATYYASGTGFLSGLRTLPTQFKVPNDDPQYGWIKAEND
jgi:hypothetical protein